MLERLADEGGVETVHAAARGKTRGLKQVDDGAGFFYEGLPPVGTRRENTIFQEIATLIFRIRKLPRRGGYGGETVNRG